MALSCWEKLGIVLLSAVGLRILVRLSVFLWKKILAPYFGLAIDVTTQGKWAVVTGATDGLGKAFARAFADKGLDVVLVSRTLSRLEDVAAEIKQDYGVETRIVEADLTKGQSAYAKVEKVVEDLEVAVLVNSAGASYPHPEFFTATSDETIAMILQLNVAALTGITRVVLPRMVERKKGVIINISSTVAEMPSPFLTVYSASKAFVVKFSADLAAEVAKSGVTVQCLIPGLVATKMSKIKKPTWMAPTPSTYVASALTTLGLEHLTTGYPPHILMLGFVKALQCMCEKGAIWLVTKTTLNIRSRALRQKARLEECQANSNGNITENPQSL